MLGWCECQTGGHRAVSLASRLFQSQDRRSPARSGIQSVSVLESRAAQNLRAGESASPAQRHGLAASSTEADSGKEGWRPAKQGSLNCDVVNIEQPCPIKALHKLCRQLNGPWRSRR